MRFTRDQDSALSTRSRRKPPGLRGRRGFVVPLVLVAGLALAACSSGSPSSAPPTTASSAGAGNGAGTGGGAGTGAGGGLSKGVTVTVESVSAGQLSVRTKAGNTKTVLIGSATTVTQNGQPSSASAIKAGQTLLVKGSRNSAGQIVATSITIE